MICKVGRGNSGHSSGLLALFRAREERTTTETDTAHFYLSLCSIHVLSTKLYACVDFSKVTETRYPLELSQNLGSGVIRDT